MFIYKNCLVSLKRTLKTSSLLLKTLDLKNRSKSSQEWLIRQTRDRYVKMAKYKNYRARSAFKLIEMDDRFNLLRPGDVVVECGAAPGAWTQVAIERINSSQKDEKKPIGEILALDLQYIEPLIGATVLSNADMTKLETHKKILDMLNGKKVDVVLSDMCPTISGIRDLDSDNSLKLFCAALHLSISVLKHNGTFLAKSWDQVSVDKIQETLLKYFETKKIVKPQASRSDSSEIYVLCRNFKQQM